MEFECFAMHFQLLLVFYNGLLYVLYWVPLCFLMGLLNSSIGFSFVVYWVPLAFLCVPFIILRAFACFLMDPLHSSVGFPLSPSLFYAFVLVF